MQLLKLLFICIMALTYGNAMSHFKQQWVLHIPGGEQTARAVAEDHDFDLVYEIFPNEFHFVSRRLSKRSIMHDKDDMRLKTRFAVDTRIAWSQHQVVKRRVKRTSITQGPDPNWTQMWYLNRGNGLDMNVVPAWKEGITGKGVVVTILDDGIEFNHPDLVNNYDPNASYDVNNNDGDPSPRYDSNDSNRHGTRCAGEVAATRNNSVCASGVAYGAYVGGVRMLDGDVTDAVEARALSLNSQHIHVYSASWGPDDDGKTVDGPGSLANRAFVEGVTRGRDGKGSIFVWASGNGGHDQDNCNCDGYTNSIYTLSISSATENGRVPWYSEACSSTLATTYSSGALNERQVVTTDLRHMCTSSHTGTSASAPLAAGICALALQANMKLTWRDMQHIVIRTARPQNLVASDWRMNGVGRNISHSFGYGLMDAYAMVQLARKWKTVPPQRRCEILGTQYEHEIPPKTTILLNVTVTSCEGIEVLEHVQANVTLSSQRRGDLSIYLISPMGTRATLLANRGHDISRAGFKNWPFMSVHSWGESPFGLWQLEIANTGFMLSNFSTWNLTLYGTAKEPATDAIDYENANSDHNRLDPYDPSDTDDTQQRRWHSHDESQKAKPQTGRKDKGKAVYSWTSNAENGGVGNALTPDLDCPTGHFEIGGACNPCHYTCWMCSGPTDTDCTRCYPDSTLIHISNTEKYCYPSRFMSAFNVVGQYQRLFIACAVLIIMVVVFLCWWCCLERGWKRCRNAIRRSRYAHFEEHSVEEREPLRSEPEEDVTESILLHDCTEV